VKIKVDAKRRFLAVPAQFEICSGEQATAACITRAMSLLAGAPVRAAIVSGPGRTAEIARRIGAAIGAGAAVHHQVLNACTRAHVQESAQALSETTDLLIAVGGGSVIDPAKLIAGELKVPLIVVATALSSDCFGSPVAVLLDDSGKKISLPAVIPSFVVVDTAVTTMAPGLMALAGLCDVLSNASAILDAKAARENAGVQLDNFALALAEGAYRLLLPVDWNSLHTPIGHETLVKALIMSGLAMGFSGDSSPCSGAEHSISHAIDFLYPGAGAHGLQVGITTVYCHYLRKCAGHQGLPEDVVGTLRYISPALEPAALGLSRAQFLAAAAMGRQIRPTRFTILNQLKGTDAFEEAYDAAFTAGGARP